MGRIKQFFNGRAKYFFKSVWINIEDFVFNSLCFVAAMILIAVGTIVMKRRPRKISILGAKKWIVPMYLFIKTPRYKKGTSLVLVAERNDDEDFAYYDFNNIEAAQDKYDSFWNQHKEEKLIVKLAKLTGD